MQAARYDAYGDPDTLSVGEVPEPHAGAGQVRIRVRTSSVNPFDWKVRRGFMAEMMPMTFPVVPGADAAGVVDEVGEGVDGVGVGEEVFGLGSRTNAAYAVLDHWARKPAAMSWPDAAAAGLPLETAARAVEDLDLHEGDVLLVEGAAGAVGQSAVQLARRRGVTVVGTASPGNHDRLRELGVTPTTYGPGLADRLAALGTGPVTAVLDAAGSGSLPELIAIAGDPQRVLSVADFSAVSQGARMVRSEPRATQALSDAADAYAAGEHSFVIDRVFSLADVAQAHARSEGGARGRVILAVSDDDA